MGKKKGKGKGLDEKWSEDDKLSSPSLPEGRKEEEEGLLMDNPVAQRGGKKGKKDRKKKGFDDDWEDELPNEQEGLGEVGGTAQPLEDKPGEGMDELAKESEVMAGGGKKGKKKRKKDDWEDDLADELEELGLVDDKEQNQKQSEQPDKQETPVSDDKSGAEEQPKEAGKSGGGKKGKKKKKNEAWEEDIDALAHEIEVGGGMDSGQQQPESQSKATKVDTKDKGLEDKPQPSGSGAGVGGKEEEEEGEEGHTVLTPAQKKAAKREREKKKKEAAKKAKQQQGSQKEEEKSKKTETVNAAPTGQNEGSSVEMKDQSPPETAQKPVEEGSDGEGAVGEEGEEGGDGDDKKKKKKKKKKTEEEKKGKVKKPGKSAILGIKKQIEALRLEQKRREEEELALQRAEEEAERKRQEELQLEKERKEKKKQKEKERKERRRLEGKPMTKAEKERHAKAQAQLRALEAQGITVPGKAQDGGERKKVRYGSRQRPKKPKQASEIAGDIGEIQEEPDSVPSETTTESVQEPQSNSDEEVKDNWDEISGDEEAGSVKDNWDDESGEEEEKTEARQEVTSTVVQPAKPAEQESAREVRQESVESASDEEETSSESSEEESESETEELSLYQRAKQRIENRRKRHEEERSLDILRSPVVCVLGHVDTGKTKILDKIRRTHVQDGEAGGITQQIGATFVPEEAIREQTKMVKEFAKTEIKLPGLLIIDTPGHESFSNLRVRGSSMCDIAILVVDIMHGLEPQTLESLAILRKGKTPFVVALNKIDRLFDWRRNPNSGIRDTLKRQKGNTKEEFDERVKQVCTEFAEQGLNVALFWEKVNFQEYIPVVPTSAITGDGMGDLIALLVNYSQRALSNELMLSQELEAMVMEVKVIAGLGTTIDVILRNGILSEGDTMILTGTEGPFVAQVRALLMPQPLRELRVKNAYVNHKAIIASQGVKVCGKDLEKSLAGTPVFVARKTDEIEVLKDEAAAAMTSTLNTIQLQERGVFVQASTLGSLEALLTFLKQSKIPYAGVNIGPVHKKDVMKASVMLEHDSQWAVILAFDVRVERDAQEMADSLGVKIFVADIIYHLFDNFLKHRAELREQKRKEYEHIAVFPCRLRVLPNCIFNTRDPIVVGVVVEDGVVKPGTPLTVPSKSFTDIGVVSSLEANHKPVDIARKGMEVCLKIEHTGGDAPRLYGRHFDHTDMLVSKISRESIDAVKNYFREDLQKSDWQLIIELKKQFQIL